MNSQNTFKSLRPKRCANFMLSRIDGTNVGEEMPPNCSHSRISRIQTVDEIKNGYNHFRKGDIVKIRDSEDGNDYFGQISEFIVNKYAEKFAMVVWLTPKFAISTRGFDSNNYEHSIAEQRPIPLSACEFECHCPKVSAYITFIEWSPDVLIRKKIRNELNENIYGKI